MATNPQSIQAGLFSGSDPFAARRAARNAIVERFAVAPNLNAGTLFSNNAASAGAGLARDIGGLFGAKFPEERRAEAIQQVQQAISEKGLSPAEDPEFYTETAQLFQAAGLPDLALRTQEVGGQVIPQIQARRREGAQRGFIQTAIVDSDLPDNHKRALLALPVGEAAKAFNKLQDPETEITEVDGRVKLLNLNTGETIQDLGAATEGSATSRTRQQRIDELTLRLQETQGMGLTDAKRRAIDIVDKNIDLEVVPETGRVRETDVVTGTAREVPLSGGPERVEVPQGATLYDLASQGVTGAVPGLVEAASGPLGQIPGVDFGQETTTMRQILRASSRNLIRSLSINPRFPVAEQERIRKEVNTLPSLLGSEEQLKSRMTGLDRQLRRDIAQAERDAADSSLPEEVRESQAGNASSMRNFVDQMGVAPPLPRDVAGLDGLSDAELARRFETTPDFELRALPADTLKELRARLQEAQ